MTGTHQFREQDHRRGLDGKFAVTEKLEARGVEPLKLFDREDGTFLNPPASKTAEHCIRFWSTVEIPDEIVVAFRDAQDADYHQRINADFNRQKASWQQRWIQDNPRGTQDQLDAAWAQNEPSVIAECRARNPHLRYQDAPQAIRALQMFRWSPDESRWPHEADRVLSHEIETFGGTLSVQQVVDVHRLGRVEDVLDRMPEPRNQNEGLNSEILEALRAMSGQLQRIDIGIENVSEDVTATRHYGMNPGY